MVVGVGLMGALADSALEAGGKVIGVMPHGLVTREVAHTALTELHVVDTMHERKAIMAEHSDASLHCPAVLALSKSSSKRGHGRNSACTRSRSLCSTSNVIGNRWCCSCSTSARKGFYAEPLRTC